jgi:CRP-like cAMP-binding protein
MLTAVERVIVLRHADLLKDVGPRRLLALAELAHEVEIAANDVVYAEEDPSDVLYIVVEGRVRLSAGGRTISEVGPNESFGTWALVDDSGSGQQAVCTEDGLLLALHRDEFYDVAAGDLTLLLQVVRALARRLRELVAERPEEARVESEGVEKTGATEAEESAGSRVALAEPPQTPGAALTSAALGQPAPAAEPDTSEPMAPGEPPPIPPGTTSPVSDDRP